MTCFEVLLWSLSEITDESYECLHSWYVVTGQDSLTVYLICHCPKPLSNVLFGKLILATCCSLFDTDVWYLKCILPETFLNYCLIILRRVLIKQVVYGQSVICLDVLVLCTGFVYQHLLLHKGHWSYLLWLVQHRLITSNEGVLWEG